MTEQESNLQESTFNGVVNNLIKLVAIHGHPASMVSDQAFQDLIAMVVPENKKNYRINAGFIENMIPNKANEIRRNISAEIQDKLLTLKLDFVTHMERTFVGVSLQYVKDIGVVLRTIAVVEMNDKNDKDYLMEELNNILILYKIHLIQIYSVAIDGNVNSKKELTEYLNEYFHKHNTVSFNTEENNLGLNLPKCETNAQKIATNINPVKTCTPRVMICAANLIHSTADDTFKTDEMQSYLDTARNVVKTCKLPENQRYFNGPALLLDGLGWRSIYDMLGRLRRLSHRVKNVPAVKSEMTEAFWYNINSITDALIPISTLNYYLKNDHYGIGDIYLKFLNWKENAKTLSTPYTVSLLKSIEKHEAEFLETDTVLEALYMDSRLRVTLTEDQMTKARVLLKETLKKRLLLMLTRGTTSLGDLLFEPYFKEATTSVDDKSTLYCPKKITTQELIDEIEPVVQAKTSRGNISVDVPEKANENKPVATTSDKTKPIPSQSTDDVSVVEAMLNKMMTQRGKTLEPSVGSIDALFKEVATMPHLSPEDDVLSHWRSNECVPGVLRDVAYTTLAAAASQQSYAQLKDSLKVLVKSPETVFKTGLMEHMIVIRSNPSLCE